VTVLGRIHADGTQERPSHDLGTAEAALGGDDFDAGRRVLETSASDFDPSALDESGWCRLDTPPSRLFAAHTTCGKDAAHR
jgi:hypothetical protein